MSVTLINGEYHRNPSGCHNKVKWILSQCKHDRKSVEDFYSRFRNGELICVKNGASHESWDNAFWIANWWVSKKLGYFPPSMFDKYSWLKTEYAMRRRMYVEFDKSKVYTVLNADELKVGSKVIVGDNLLELKENVIKHRLPKIIKKVESEDSEHRFLCDDDFHYTLAYLTGEGLKEYVNNVTKVIDEAKQEILKLVNKNVKLEQQLVKAKELLKRGYNNYIYLEPLRSEIEQFLKEADK